MMSIFETKTGIALFSHPRRRGPTSEMDCRLRENDDWRDLRSKLCSLRKSEFF